MEDTILTISELSSYLKLGRSSTYALVHRPDFKTVRIGRKNNGKDE